MGDVPRYDKYIWCVRLTKTRTLATDLCRRGRIRVKDEPIKASREPRVGEEFTLHDQGIVRTFRVLALLGNRVGAKLVAQYLEDLTPQETYDQVAMLRKGGFERRDRGTGRPTKRERRDIDHLKSPDE